MTENATVRQWQLRVAFEEYTKAVAARLNPTLRKHTDGITELTARVQALEHQNRSLADRVLELEATKAAEVDGGR